MRTWFLDNTDPTDRGLKVKHVHETGNMNNFIVKNTIESMRHKALQKAEEGLKNGPNSNKQDQKHKSGIQWIWYPS